MLGMVRRCIVIPSTGNRLKGLLVRSVIFPSLDRGINKASPGLGLYPWRSHLTDIRIKVLSLWCSWGIIPPPRQRAHLGLFCLVPLLFFALGIAVASRGR